MRRVNRAIRSDFCAQQINNLLFEVRQLNLENMDRTKVVKDVTQHDVMEAMKRLTWLRKENKDRNDRILELTRNLV